MIKGVFMDKKDPKDDQEESKTAYPLVVGDKKEEKDIATKKPSKLAEVFTKPSSFSFINKVRKKRIDSYTDVVKSETTLMDSLGTHVKTKNRLKDIHVEIETESHERQNNLNEAKVKGELFESRKELAKLDLELAIAEKKKELEKLKGGGREGEKISLDEKLIKKQERIALEAKMRSADLLGSHVFSTEINKEYRRIKDEILAGREEDSLSDDEKLMLENLKDARDTALDNID